MGILDKVLEEPAEEPHEDFEESPPPKTTNLEVLYKRKIRIAARTAKDSQKPSVWYQGHLYKSQSVEYWGRWMIRTDTNHKFFIDTDSVQVK